MTQQDMNLFFASVLRTMEALADGVVRDPTLIHPAVRICYGATSSRTPQSPQHLFLHEQCLFVASDKHSFDTRSLSQPSDLARTPSKGWRKITYGTYAVVCICMYKATLFTDI